MSLYQEIQTAVQAIREKIDIKPTVGIILGSGLGKLADKVTNPQSISYDEIPGFLSSTVAGHEGKLIFGQIGKRDVVLMKGRLHYYEGYTMKQITFPVQVMKELGCESMLVTNAAGGIHSKLQPGDLMLLCDHINLMGDTPLRGPNDERMGVRFPPMAQAYDLGLRRKVHVIAASNEVPLSEGVYCALPGPSYETPAEIRYIQTIGGDAVGMSTVPEVLVARHRGMKVIGISCITNILHEGPSKDTHEDVLKSADQASNNLISLVTQLIGQSNEPL